jgi:hypothetical protein
VAGVASGRKGTFAYWNQPASLGWSNYVLSATLNAADDDGIGLLFRYQNRSNYYKVELDRQQGFRKLLKVVSGAETLLASEAAGYPMGADLALRVQADGSQIGVWLDAAPLFGGVVADDDLSTGTVALYAWASAGLMFDDVYVTPIPYSTPLAVPRLPPSVKLTSPSEGAYLLAPAVVLLSAEIAGNSNNISEVKFYRNTQPLGMVLRPPFTLVCSNIAPHDNVFTAQARENTGVVGQSPPVHVYVTWTPLAPLITVQPRSQLAVVHTEVQLTVQASGTWPLTYQWFRGNAPIAGATNTLLTLRDLQTGGEGVYWVEVRNSTGVAAIVVAFVDAADAAAFAKWPTRVG